MNRVAAIDIGSNSILLAIAEPGSAQAIPLKILVDEAHVTSLSKGVIQSKMISNASLERSFGVFRRYRELLDEFKIDRMKVVGTEVFRRANNGEDVRKKISEIIQAPVEIISGEREAELSFWSVQKEFSNQSAKIVFDIGGASTEVCWGSENGIEKRVSLKVGSVVLTEQFGLNAKSKIEPALSHVKGLLREVEWTKSVPPTTGIGVAGTITTLFAVEQKLAHYSRSAVHGKTLSTERLQSWAEEVLKRTVQKRAELPGLPEDRADVFGGGLTIALALAQYFQWHQICCMDSGVRFGLLYEQLGF